jgi:FAD/FMN-containing dehydrogenase
MTRSILYALSAAALFPFASAQPQQNACKIIDVNIPGRISYPDSTAYNSSVSSYYSDQERDLYPGCIFQPTNTSEVSQFVKLVTACEGAKFAVRGGGHTLWTGAANINGGITVDMRSMKDFALSPDKKIALLGAGGIWNEIYPQLVPYNLTAMGGRVPGIGVGGFVTGGKTVSD